MRNVRPALVWCTLFSFINGPACLGAQPYLWERTTQSLQTASRVDVTAQEDNDDDTDSDSTNGTFAASNASQEITRAAKGGGGGGGGDSGEEDPVLDGEGGGFADSTDGDDGLPGNDAFAGLGGKAGEDGVAEASATAAAIDETNPDYEEYLSYSWIHNQSGDITVQGGAGGG